MCHLSPTKIRSYFRGCSGKTVRTRQWEASCGMLSFVHHIHCAQEHTAAGLIYRRPEQDEGSGTLIIS